MQAISHKHVVWVLSALLLAMIVAIHWNWLTSLSPLVSGDWPYYYGQTLKEWSPFHPLWINYDSLGRGIVQANFIGLFSIYALLAHLGMNFETISRLLFFIPVAILTPLFSYVSLKRVSNSPLGAIVGTFVYSINSYFLVIQGGHMHLAVTYALAPLAYFYALGIKQRDVLGLVLVVWLVSLYDVRMSLVIMGVSTLLAAYNRYSLGILRLSFVRQMFVATIALVSLSSFWALPMVAREASVLQENRFGQAALNWVEHTNALGLHHPFWSSEGVTDFTFHQPQPYDYTISLLVILALLLLRTRYHRLTLFFAILATASIVLLLQNNSLLGGLYDNIYRLIPLMSMFRESTKMYFFVLFSYAAILSIFIRCVPKLFDHYHDKKYTNSLLAAYAGLVVLSTCLVSMPYLRGNYVKTFREEKISDEISSINDLVAPNDSESYRNLWISRVPKFARFTQEKPSLDMFALSATWNAGNQQVDPTDYLKNDSIKGLLDMANIKYVIVPADDIDTNYRHYGEDRDADYYDAIVDRWGLEKIYETTGGTVWRNHSLGQEKVYATTRVVGQESTNFGSHVDFSTPSVSVFMSQNMLIGHTETQLSSMLSTQIFHPFTPNRMSVTKGRITGAEAPFNQPFDVRTGFENSSTLNPTDYTEIVDERVEGLNLYSDGSFESRADFSLFDAAGDDGTSLTHNGIVANFVDDATDGVVGIEVSARRHIADLSNNIDNFDPNSYYLVSLDYKYISGLPPQVGVYPYANIPHNRMQNLDSSSPGGWSHFSTLITPASLQSDAYLLIYLPTRNDQDVPSISRFDNIQIYKLPFRPTTYVEKNIRTTTTNQEPSISINSSSPTRFSGTLTELNEPTMLVLGETYDPNWELEITDANSSKPPLKLNEGTHYVVNGFANGWYINSSMLSKLEKQFGSREYSITIKYKPQRYFNVGLVISGVTLGGCIIYLGYDSFRSRRTHRKKS
ncbi:hypothetical protein CR970_03035 [Candidatus Saccharibacteria bacterium]|nr:MAG: hypothetical protein CR970_03035 [Candidatus Saccharibacteria bacterium]